MGDQQPTTAGTGAGFSYPIPKGLGDLNYLQSLLAAISTQELNTDSAPTFLALTLTSLTASKLTGTDGSKTLISLDTGASLSLSGTTLNTIQNIRTTDSPTFAALKLTTGAGLNKVWTSDADGDGTWATPALAPAAHVLDGALHTVSGLTGGHFLKATGATTFGFAVHGLTYTDVGALASGGTAVDSDKLDGQHGAYYAVSGAAPAAHAFIDTTGHTASGLTNGHFLKATGATTYAFGAHGLTYSDVGAEVAGATVAHAALITGVHGLVFTAGKTLTLTESLTLNALPIGGLAVATGANTLGSLAVGLTTQVLVGGGAATVPAWATDLPTAVTIGTAYVYRAGGTDVAVADGGTNLSSYAVGDILYASAATTIAKLAGVAAGQPLLSGGVTTAPAYAGYTFSGTAAQTYTFPGATCTLQSTTGTPAAFVIASQAAGDILFASSGTAWARLAVSTAGKVLAVKAGATELEWITPGTGPHTLEDTNNTTSGRTAGQILRATAATTYGWTTLTMPDTAVKGAILYGSATNVISALAAGTAGYMLETTGAAGSETPGWVLCTGTGAPVRAGSPTFTTKLTTPAIEISDAGTIGLGAGKGLIQFDDETTDCVSFSNCNVGIGTSAPTSALYILKDSVYTGGETSAHGINIGTGTVTANDHYLYMGADKTNDCSYIQSVGNNACKPLALQCRGGSVGIGAITPGTVFEINAANAMQRFRHGTDDAGNMGIEFAHRALGSNIIKTAIISEADSGGWGRANLHFIVDIVADINAYTLGTDTKMFIDGGTGFVGIGTVAPGSLFDCNGAGHFQGSVTATSYVTGTPAFEGDALAELILIKSKDGQLDHDTLPVFVRAEHKDREDDILFSKPGQDLGAMISMFTVAIQQLNTRLSALEKKI